MEPGKCTCGIQAGAVGSQLRLEVAIGKLLNALGSLSVTSSEDLDLGLAVEMIQKVEEGIEVTSALSDQAVSLIARSVC